MILTPQSIFLSLVTNISQGILGKAQKLGRIQQ